MVLKEQWQVLLFLWFFLEELSDNRDWVLEGNLSIVILQIQMVEMCECWRIEQGTVVECSGEFQKHENMLGSDPINDQIISEEGVFIVDSSGKVQTELHQSI